MATAELKSDLLTNTESTPVVQNAACNSYGKLRVISSTVEVSTAIDAGDIVAMCKLPANASVKSIRSFTDALGAGKAHVGLYTGPDSSTLTVADADCYAATYDFGAGADTAGTEIAYLNTTARAISNINKKVYEDAGDSAGDFEEYWLCLTCDTEDFTTTSGATISLVVTLAVE